MSLLFLILATCWAYIPEYSLIASHAADQHGKGSFLIEQDVVYSREGENFSVKETWLINNENSMRVTLEGRGPLKGLVQGTILYDGGQKRFLESGASTVRAQRLGEEWLEPLFHFRNSKYFRNKMVSLKVAPSDSLHERPPLSNEGEVKYEPPAFLRLSRVGGDVAWAITNGSPSGNNPEAWIEQDQFVLRKLRTPSQVLLRAEDYNHYDDGLWFPRQRTYNFGNYTVYVQTLLVKSLGKIKGDDPRFRMSSLNPARDGLKLPEGDALKEFYSRFR